MSSLYSDTVEAFAEERLVIPRTPTAAPTAAATKIAVRMRVLTPLLLNHESGEVVRERVGVVMGRNLLERGTPSIDVRWTYRRRGYGSELATGESDKAVGVTA
jgi:hypothetical protein